MLLVGWTNQFILSHLIKNLTVEKKSRVWTGQSLNKDLVAQDASKQRIETRSILNRPSDSYNFLLLVHLVVDVAFNTFINL